MNTLNKKVILYAVSALALTATTGFLLQTESYVGLKKDFKTLFKANEKNKQQIKDQALTIEQLGEEILIKDDSIATLNSRVVSLIEEINKLKNKVHSLDKKIRQKNDKMVALTNQINSLKKSGSASDTKIAALTKERDELLVKIEQMDLVRFDDTKEIKKKKKEIVQNDVKLNQLQVEIDEAQDKINRTNTSPPKKEPVYAAPSQPSEPSSIEDEKEKIIKARKQARMHDIVKNTTIDYRSIQLKEKKEGNGLKKLKDNDWRYAVITFDLKNEDSEAIYDEDFTIQIYDVDNQTVVPINERNPNFPESDLGSTGYSFTYEGKPMEITYFNSQKKTGKNYEARLFYAGRGFLIPIANGKNRIVKDGLIAVK